MADQYQQMVSTTNVPGAGGVFFAGDFPRAVQDVTILTGQAAFPRGTVLAKSGTKYVGINPAASDGTEVPVGVLGIATAAATGDVYAYMFVTGEFNEDMLLDRDGVKVTAAAILTALKALNIYPRKVS